MIALRVVLLGMATIILALITDSPRESQIKLAETSYSLDLARKLTNLPILPALRGFGTLTVAGSGRQLTPPRTRIYRIRDLADSGPGTLRECINLREPRTCLFEVSGEIALDSKLRIRNPYITIAGQTAPKPGITITRGGFSVETHDVLIQHLAVRPGDQIFGVKPQFRDGVSIGAQAPKAAYNVVLDHLSLSWAIDENLSTAYPSTHDITISQSLIAEGLHHSIHPKGPHSKGVMIGNDSQRITLYQNVIAANEERNPYIKPGSSVEMINNIVYGWGSNGGWSLCNLTNNDGSSDPVQLSFIGNIYIPGPWSFIAPPLYANYLATRSKIYVEDNRLMTPSYDLTNPWKISGLGQETFRTEIPPVASENSAILTSEAAYATVLNKVGSRPLQRSQTDRRIISEIQNRTGSIKDCLKGCTNAVGAESQLIGKKSHTRTLNIPRAPFTDTNRDGYTALENWLHRLAKRLSPTT
jgi:hypothetical protein